MFKIRVENRVYDLHRPGGCTVLAIEVEGWPGNEFGFWLPETVFADNGVAWGNWEPDAFQKWENDGGTFQWKKQFENFSLVSTLEPDPGNACLWFTHRFENTSGRAVTNLNTQNCLHLVNAPEFVSIRGERIWACLDGRWMTTDRVPREESPDPRRVFLYKKGVRSERTVVPDAAFPSALMPEEACHPLIAAETFRSDGSVGIACRNFRKLFNNNDCILRCLHSEAFPIARLEPGESATREGVILWEKGGHEALVARFERVASDRWGEEAV